VLQLHKAIVAAWNQAGLDQEFTVYWPDSARGNFPVLLDNQAAPGQPLPYCLFQQRVWSVNHRASGQGGSKIEVPVTFVVCCKEVGGLGAKQIAASLADKVKGVFGGHQTQPPQGLQLDYGEVLLSQLEGEYGIREEEDVFQWLLEYLFHLDVPVVVQ